MNDFPICIGKKESSKFNIIINVVLIVLLLVLVFQVTFYSRFARIYVVGDSMKPTLIGASAKGMPGGDYVYADKYKTPQRGDIIVLSVGEDNTVLIKRVIAVGGDTVELKQGVLYLNGEETEESYIFDEYNSPLDRDNTLALHTVEEGCIFFMGDNRNVSQDSRNKYGDVEVSAVIGVVTEWSVRSKSFITGWNTFFDFTIRGKSQSSVKG